MCGAMCPMTITLANFCLMAFSISYINGILLQDTHSINGGANSQYRTFTGGHTRPNNNGRCHSQYPTFAGGMRGGVYGGLGEAERFGYAAESAPRRG